MGFEIKNICTVVPNPYHPAYNPSNTWCYDGGKYYYFSLFITPRLQFDGTLKEFYEMLHWPEYAEKIFWPFQTKNENPFFVTNELSDNIYNEFSACSLFSPGMNDHIQVQKDYTLLKDLLIGMNIINKREDELDSSHIDRFLAKAKKVWKKLFHERVPVEAWPIYIKPQLSAPVDKEIENLTNLISSLKIDSIKLSNNMSEKFHSQNGQNSIVGIVLPGQNNLSQEQKDLQRQIDNKEKEIEGKTKSLRDLKNQRNADKFNQSKFRQEFHKKISALARYPHVLRVLGLIQDFKVEKSQISNINVPDFLLRMEFNTSIASTNPEDYPFDEFFRSVQFVRPYTKCECNRDKLRSHFVDPTNPGDKGIYGDNVPNYNEFVLDGFLRTFQTKENAVFSVDQNYYEDQTSDITQINEKQDSNVIGINTKVFSEEDVAVIKQKAADKPKISKGFSIKVHGQPRGILVNMDEQFQKITDDNIEGPQSAFMAHHLDCGYRVDVQVTVCGKPEWKSLCKREAKYIVDRKDDDWKVPMFGKPITFYRDSDTLFELLKDEPWLEEVRQIDEDGNANRFEEIARWNGWSLTCPPLYKKDSASTNNNEADDMELRDIRPPENSLPKLRFGNTYKFRIRTVDICGNGPCLEDELDKSLENDYVYTPKENGTSGYQRKEIINPPMFFAPYPIVLDLHTANEDEIDKIIEDKKKEDGFKINALYKGEDNETLVIRTKITLDGKTEPWNEECIRYLTPQHMTMHFAETSGMLDLLYKEAGKGKGLKSLYTYLSAKPKTFYNKDELNDKNIPFLTDPKIGCLSIGIGDKLIPFKGAEPTFREKEKPEDAINNEAIKLLLTSELDKNKELNLTHNRSLIHFSLQAGVSKTFNITSISISDSESSIRKDFRIIHAVQRPYLESDKVKNNEIIIANFLHFEKKIPQPDSYKPDQKYQVEIKPDKSFTSAKVFFPFSSTGELILHAEYCDYELNPNNPNGWSYISKDYPKESEKDIKRKKQTSTNKAEEADKFYITKSWSNLDESTQTDKFDTLLTNLIDPEDFNPENSSNKIQENYNFFIHAYPDTKFRKVKYKLEAVSKFSEFFDIEKHKIDYSDKNPFSVFAILDPQQAQAYDPVYENSDCYYTIIKNSAKPSKPNITSIVPVFNVENPSPDNKYIFKHKTFRVYLGNNWYETGLGEKIAVIHERTANTLRYQENGDPMVAMMQVSGNEVVKDSSYLKNKISIFANDPTGAITSSRDSVKRNPETYINNSSVLLNTYLFENTVESPSRIEDQQKEHVFSVFDVYWDKQQNQFYCDIELNEKALTAYTYLLKFALCRYQEHSIICEGKYDYRFSDVVMTDMVSILPHRQIEKLTNDKFKISGKFGGRYIRKEGNLVFNSNKIYLISEEANDVSAGIACLFYDKKFEKIGILPEQFDQDITIDAKKQNFIEEYEDIPLDDNFYMNDKILTEGKLEDSNYNPRNDPRKRLVFFYKIPNL